MDASRTRYKLSALILLCRYTSHKPHVTYFDIPSSSCLYVLPTTASGQSPAFRHFAMIRHLYVIDDIRERIYKPSTSLATVSISTTFYGLTRAVCSTSRSAFCGLSDQIKPWLDKSTTSVFWHRAIVLPWGRLSLRLPRSDHAGNPCRHVHPSSH